jgi:hypothetical protein
VYTCLRQRGGAGSQFGRGDRHLGTLGMYFVIYTMCRGILIYTVLVSYSFFKTQIIKTSTICFHLNSGIIHVALQQSIRGASSNVKINRASDLKLKGTGSRDRFQNVWQKLKDQIQADNVIKWSGVRIKNFKTCRDPYLGQDVSMVVKKYAIPSRDPVPYPIHFCRNFWILSRDPIPLKTSKYKGKSQNTKSAHKTKQTNWPIFPAENENNSSQ